MADNLEHIIWNRLPDISPPRRRGRYFPSVPLRQDRSDHSTQLKQAIDGSLQGVRRRRQQSGIDPSRLIVLELSFLQENQRELLEKLQVFIVDEREIFIPSPVTEYSVTVTFKSEQLKDSFTQTSSHIVSFISTSPIRGSQGQVDSLKLEVRFAMRDEASRLISQFPQLNLGIEGTTKNPSTVKGYSQFRLTVEFEDEAATNRFLDEWQAYSDGRDETLVLTARERGILFDALEDFEDVQIQDRVSQRIQELLSKQASFTEPAYVDVDLWHPGNPQLRGEAIRQFRDVVNQLGGRVTDGPTSVAETLLIARVHGDREVIEWIASYDRTALVDLPPEPTFFTSTTSSNFQAPQPLPQVPQNGPLACIIDSGVTAGHPLLDGIVLDEVDFQSGESIVSDTVGHGTHVTGIVVYGDVQKCFDNSRWEPEVNVLSGKVLKKSQNGTAQFADEKRVETQIHDAISYFHREYGCRIFNLSIGHPQRLFSGGRQHPWALLLDELARDLDVVIVVPVGNQVPDIPPTPTTPQLQEQIRG